MPADAQEEQAASAPALDLDGLGDLPAASSFLSSRWSRDNLVTAHPARLYDGPVLERVGPDLLEALVQEFAAERGQFRVGPGRMGVFTWDIEYEDETGSFVLQVPLALDGPGTRGRAKRDVPRQNVENARYFSERGLTRFVVEPEGLVTLGGGVPAAIFRALPGHRSVTFGGGALRVRLPDGWTISLGASATAELLAELVAALVYHYEPELDGGTALTDVFVNDGDFAVRRRGDGSFDVRLTALRRRDAGISPNLLVLYLVQLMAYEDFGVDGALTGLPVLISNPSVAFEGVTRGLVYRERDGGGREADAVQRAREWIAEFGRSREGRMYRPWVERFLEGRLKLRFGDDPRERWWRLFPLERKLRLLELRGRADPASGAAASARTLKTFLDRLARDVGRSPEEDPLLHRINDLGGDGMSSLLADAQVEAGERKEVAREIFESWPYRSLDQLLARVPRARGLRRSKGRLSFGWAFPMADEGTLKALGPAAKTDAGTRPLANPEIFGALALPPSLVAEAVRTFPTFEAYMDTALQDPSWGYYPHAVVIGKEGHFDTHPEELSPDYGSWVAAWAFKAWRELVDRGELGEVEPFPVIEFGAGNGRLASDVLAAIARGSDELVRGERERFETFRAHVQYRIYEMSESLRARQRELLGERAIVAAGDARSPRATLARDFPDGVKGFVVTNEVPDAFGVHKVVLTADGRAFVALVVPRVESACCAALDGALAERIAETDASIRRTFGFASHGGDRYLDQATFGRALEAIWRLPSRERDAALDSVWFEEAYVPASAVPELAAHLAANAREYATALAAEVSGVVVYVNVHAGSFIRELGSSLAAGFVLTIDYGDSTWGLVQGARRGDFPFRVYGETREDHPRPNDPYAAPGSQDMTADVNFTELANAGEAVGLHLIHFGPERDVSGDSLPELLRAAQDGDRLGKFLGHPGFKLLMLGTRPSGAFITPLSTALSLHAREQDVPKSLRDKIPVIQRTLRALAR
jgi:SAM-dependent MidA family methyltransferase